MLDFIKWVNYVKKPQKKNKKNKFFFSSLICIYVYTNICNWRNVMKETKLTSVKIIDNLYKNFKSKVVQNGFNLQKLVNRSIYLYNEDSTFESKIHNEDSLTQSGSCF